MCNGVYVLKVTSVYFRKIAVCNLIHIREAFDAILKYINCENIILQYENSQIFEDPLYLCFLKAYYSSEMYWKLYKN